MPTQVVSNEEFIPRRQNERQKHVEHLIGEMAEQRAHKLGMDRRSFMTSTMGLATCFLASNMVFGKQAWAVDEIETAADKITHETVSLLHRTFITPFDRDNIHRLITRMDDVMDYVEAAAERIALYELTVMTADVRDMADCLYRAAAGLTKQLTGAVQVACAAACAGQRKSRG